jgi:hypothetical protein
MDLTKLTDDRLQALIENHRRLGRKDVPLFAAALEELNRRKRAGLDFHTSLRLLWQAARERRFVSYKDIADASGADWTRVRYLVNGHLWDLVDWGASSGVPMLSAIVVDKGNVDTGRKEPSGLKAFTDAARLLGHRVDDPETFSPATARRVFRLGGAKYRPHGGAATGGPHATP